MLAKVAALAAALLCLAGVAAGCSVTKGKSRYPEQYQAFKDTANAACKDWKKANDAGRPRRAVAAIRRLLSAKPPRDLERRWKIFQSDMYRYIGASDTIADRAENALTDAAIELGLDDCLE